MISTYGHQLIEQDDIDAVNTVLRSNWLTTGPVVEEFEIAFARRTGADYAIACSSGTAALHLVAMAIGLGPGQTSMVPAISFLATANCSRFTGADVLFTDVDPDTGLMRVPDLLEVLEHQYESKVKALFLVHLNGQTCPVNELSEIARENGMVVIEDCCHALGTSYRSKRSDMRQAGSCTFSDFSVFSFHPVKTITTGEGGMITTNDAVYAEKIKSLRNHGMLHNPSSFRNRENACNEEGVVNPWYYEMHDIGLNYRISDINCALGLNQLKKLDRFIEKRKSLMACYDQALKKLAPAVRPVERVNNCSPVLHLYPVLVDFDKLNRDRADVMNVLKSKGIGVQVHYYPLHMQPYYRDLYGERELPGAWHYYERVLSLPFHCAMTEKDIGTVTATVADVLGI